MWNSTKVMPSQEAHIALNADIRQEQRLKINDLRSYLKKLVKG